ncbi:hypothetical protein M8C21_005264 [Ambrosia artemisiifolia]|uniref:BTB/POZ domain-containing protein n=1 Tax=Ambrosia artemisiifolia TaxID=4212 RepID=A0AAD5GLV4_AMBAR|nr:hypothetical protein M8C21_005264 [Ambrosia artemisiifolia]
MKFMKLGSRPDAFYSSAGVRYLLHKFPLLSKCLKLQKDCAENSKSSQLQMIELADFPGGNDVFELCVKFSYGIECSQIPSND